MNVISKLLLLYGLAFSLWATPSCQYLFKNILDSNKKDNLFLAGKLNKYGGIDYNYVTVANIEDALEKSVSLYINRINKILNNPPKDPIELLKAIQGSDKEFQMVSSVAFNRDNQKNSIRIIKAIDKSTQRYSNKSATVESSSEYEKIIGFLNKNKMQFSQADRKYIKILNESIKGIATSQEVKNERQILKLEREMNELIEDFSYRNQKKIEEYFIEYNYEELENRLPAQDLKLLIQRSKLLNNRSKEGIISVSNNGESYDIILNSSDRELRKEFYQETTLIDNEPNVQTDQISKRIFQIRNQISKLQGAKSFAEIALEDSMAKSPHFVEKLLSQLLDKSTEMAKIEKKELENFAKAQGFKEKIMPWDLHYYETLYTQSKSHISNKIIKEHFNLESTINNGLFHVAEKMWGITYKKIKTKSWSPDVLSYQIFNKKKEAIGIVHFDLFARKNKESTSMFFTEVRPITNFTSENNDFYELLISSNFRDRSSNPNLSHDDVIGLFHEFGHLLHSLHTKRKESYFRNQSMDFVELPSMFFEEYAKQPEILANIDTFKGTKKALTKTQIDGIIKQENIMPYTNMRRNLIDAYTDIYVHNHSVPKNESLASFEKRITNKWRIYDFNEIPYTTSDIGSVAHIISDGYESQLYSYMWGEFFAKQAFSKFKKNGMFNKKLVKQFTEHVLKNPGYINEMTSFKRFSKTTPTLENFINQ